MLVSSSSDIFVAPAASDGAASQLPAAVVVGPSFLEILGFAEAGSQEVEPGDVEQRNTEDEPQSKPGLPFLFTWAQPVEAAPASRLPEGSTTPAGLTEATASSSGSEPAGEAFVFPEVRAQVPEKEVAASQPASRHMTAAPAAEGIEPAMKAEAPAPAAPKVETETPPAAPLAKNEALPAEPELSPGDAPAAVTNPKTAEPKRNVQFATSVDIREIPEEHRAEAPAAPIRHAERNAERNKIEWNKVEPDIAEANKVELRSGPAQQAPPVPFVPVQTHPAPAAPQNRTAVPVDIPLREGRQHVIQPRFEVPADGERPASTEAFELTAVREAAVESPDFAVADGAERAVEPESTPIATRPPVSEAAMTAPRPATAHAPASEPSVRQRVETTAAPPPPPDVYVEDEQQVNQAPPLRQMTVRLPAENNESVSIRFAQRGEAIDVAVRATRPEVAANLRQDVPDLVEALQREGFRSDVGATHSSARQSGTADRLHLEQQQEQHSRDGGRGRPDADEWNDQRGRRRPQYEEYKDE